MSTAYFAVVIPVMTIIALLAFWGAWSPDADAFVYFGAACALLIWGSLVGVAIFNLVRGKVEILVCSDWIVMLSGFLQLNTSSIAFVDASMLEYVWIQLAGTVNETAQYHAILIHSGEGRWVREIRQILMEKAEYEELWKILQERCSQAEAYEKRGQSDDRCLRIL